ncbi:MULTISPECIES: sigma-54-dependent Fis family transcriptional regulator [Marinobacter]|uniref:sigma-54-dependent Fis family transcriptional regulator n=1 Tax=Marinobacter TaxID=2742 RepID=UPI001246B069|nr:MULTISPECIES: sigma-54-dependent Fis family transcriptional regulator [Marinobacter]MBL3556353.1 sigma 54-interacting transcriptional regulator [Marinobacter sp. JB05H06]
MSEQKLIEQFNLRSRLRFNIDEGSIWLDENRMLMLHASAFGALRKELIQSLGVQRAKGVLLRMGFESGQRDADLARKLIGSGEPYDVFRIGPELHAFEGLVKATITEAEIDWEKGFFFGTVDWQGSWEAESHIQNFGIDDYAACWSLAGYASGYVTRYFNRFVVFREEQCLCCGDDKCSIVGKPAEEWDDEDYIKLFKPDNIDREIRELREEVSSLRESLGQRTGRGDLVGESQAFRNAFNLLERAADSPINVLLLGETGVGKEVFAHWLHKHSSRADEPFVAVNCSAIPHDLIESELFGVRKGAFTGAEESRRGRFERADGGTLFLDEIGDLSPSAQVKLLRVLQSGEVERLGDDKTIKVNVRLVAATNVNLQEAIASGKFRADLYYRLSTYPVIIPPLRDRKSDIPLLAEAMIAKHAPAYSKTIKGLSDKAAHGLMEYDWPGNVRELENLIERGVLLAPEGGFIELEHVFLSGLGKHDEVAVGKEGIVSSQASEREARLAEMLLEGKFDLGRHELVLMDMAVQKAGGNLTHAAKLLGVSRRQLAYRLKSSTENSSES